MPLASDLSALEEKLTPGVSLMLATATVSLTERLSITPPAAGTANTEPVMVADPVVPPADWVILALVPTRSPI
ncbi:hypothetical protein D3C87_2031610 [compost metagenome]